MRDPHLRIDQSNQRVDLVNEVTTVGRGPGVDVSLDDRSVSRLHAELVRRGPFVYVADLGLSLNGTRVNGRPVGRKVLNVGDVISFGQVKVQLGGTRDAADGDGEDAAQPPPPTLTRREYEVLAALCRPILGDEAFVAPATARSIAAELVVTEAAVKQHLLRLYEKFRIPQGGDRRARLANAVLRSGLVRPTPPALDGGATVAVQRAG